MANSIRVSDKLKNIRFDVFRSTHNENLGIVLGLLRNQKIEVSTTWTPQQQSDYVKAFVTIGDIHPITFIVQGAFDDEIFELVDGKKRLHALKEFLAGNITIPATG